MFPSYTCLSTCPGMALRTSQSRTDGQSLKDTAKTDGAFVRKKPHQDRWTKSQRHLRTDGASVGTNHSRTNGQVSKPPQDGWAFSKPHHGRMGKVSKPHQDGWAFSKPHHGRMGKVSKPPQDKWTNRCRKKTKKPHYTCMPCSDITTCDITQT